MTDSTAVEVQQGGTPLQGYADKIMGKSDAVDIVKRRVGSITYYEGMTQGSDEWHAVRCGLLTASEVKLIITPTLKVADNDKSRSHMHELLAQRITQYVEPRYVGDDMLRGKDDEIEATCVYGERYAAVQHIGFMTNDEWGFTLGYSPDGLVGEDGQIECKSRNQKLQIATLLNYVPVGEIDPDFIIQTQTGLLVSKRKWCDLISYCGGLPMATVRVHRDEKIQSAILNAAEDFEVKLRVNMRKFAEVLSGNYRLIPTKRRIVEEMF